MPAPRLVALTVACLLLAAALCPAQHPELRRLRVLLLLDSDSNLGPGIDRDHQSLRIILTNGIPAGRLEVKVLRGDQATPANVLRYYRDLDTGPDEALLFYYSGHGALDPERGHFLQLEAGRLYRARLREAMLSRRPGLAVIVTDCCSTILKSRDARQVLGIRKPDSLHPLAGALFFRHRGVVDLTAASPGKPAFGDDTRGGFFTLALKELFSRRYHDLDSSGIGFLTWRDFFARLRLSTQETCRQRHPDPAEKQAPQTPVAHELGDPGDLTALQRRSYHGEEARQALQEVNRNKGYAVWLVYREAGREWRLLRKVRSMTSSLDRSGNRSATITVGPEHQWVRGMP